MSATQKNKQYVLVVDAEIDDRFATGLLLQRFGCNIFTAQTPEEAIEFMTVAPPSAVVADAEKSGPNLLSWITQDPRFLDVPIILLANAPNAELQGRARRGEFAALLRKPLNVDEFYKVVQAVIAKGSRRNLRIATHAKARLEDGLSGSEGHVTVLSEYGMFFRTLEPRPIKTHLQVSFAIRDRLIKLEAIVLYVTAFEEGPFKEPGMGMKFVKISRADRDLIAAFILEQLEEGITRPGSQR